MCRQGAYLTGSYALYLLGEDTDPNDIDVFVPFHKWESILGMLPDDCTTTSFKGLRFTYKEWPIDVVIGDVESFMRNVGVPSRAILLDPIAGIVLRANRASLRGER